MSDPTMPADEEVDRILVEYADPKIRRRLRVLDEPVYMPAPVSCDRCADPGRCCRRFTINRYFPTGSTRADVAAWLATSEVPFFEPIEVAGRRENNDAEEWWRFSCTKLGADGRCTIYESRPTVCRVYEPGWEALCIHERGFDGQPMVPQLADDRRPLLTAGA